MLNAADLPKIRFYDLRHTAASLMLLQGINPLVVSRMLGHSTVAFTLQQYGHVLPSMEREATSKMDSLSTRPRINT